MHEFSNPAVVLGGGATTGLGAVRSLGRAGVPVYCIEEEKTLVKYSKYCNKYFVFPRTGHDRNELKRVLLRLRPRMNDAAVVFPASDSYVLVLSDLVNELTRYYLPIVKKEVAEILVDKRRFYESLMKRNMAHPTTHFPENLEDVGKIAKEISYPTFIRPYFSESFGRFHKKGFVADSEAELLRYFVFLRRVGINAMIQEIVRGPATNHLFLDGYFDRDSNPKALFARRRLRMWPLAFGNSSLCISVPASNIPPLKETLFKYLRSISWQGIFSAEFKMDERNGIFKLLEINSRTSAWFNTLCTKCGMNIMLLAYLDAIGRDTQYSEDYAAGVKWVHLEDDLRSSILMFKNGDLTIREWISSLRGKKDHSLYAKDDPGPLVMSPRHYACMCFHRK
jgi:D-aspartate ligase